MKGKSFNIMIPGMEDNEREEMATYMNLEMSRSSLFWEEFSFLFNF